VPHCNQLRIALTAVNLKPEENNIEEQSCYEPINGACEVFTAASKKSIACTAERAGWLRQRSTLWKAWRGNSKASILIVLPTISKSKIILKNMCGPVNYSVIGNVRKLPLMVSDIYRKLTT